MSTGIVHHAGRGSRRRRVVLTHGLGCGIQAQPGHPMTVAKAGATRRVLHRLAEAETHGDRYAAGSASAPGPVAS